jgi:hypothetical protein
MLLLTVLRTSRHPQSASMPHKNQQILLLLESAIHALSNLVEHTIANFVYRRKCLNTNKSKCIIVYRH